MKMRGKQRTSLRHGVAMLLCAVCALPSLFATASAHSVVWQYFPCRVCGHFFIDVVSVSGSAFGMQLDFKQTGMLPQPWPVQKCPQCHFIISYDTEKPGGGGDYTAEEFAELRRYVLSDEYQALPPETPDYGYVVKMAEHLGGVLDFAMAGLYRAAFWQTEHFFFDDDGVENSLGDEYLRKMLAFYTKCARADNPDFDEKIISYYMKVETNRRLGRFAAAEECRKEVLLLLDSVDGDGLGEESKGWFDNIELFAEQQRQHIANGDKRAKAAVFPDRK